MNIYLDESGDQFGKIHILGALFAPSPNKLHRAISKIKIKHNYLDFKGHGREIKYTGCSNNKRYKLCKDLIDVFIASDSHYRAIFVSDSDIDYNKFGNRTESDIIKKARAYKKWGEILLNSNTKYISNAVLLADQLVMCVGDQFVERMKDAFCFPGQANCIGREVPILRHIQKVDTKEEIYQTGQLCDLLTGIITNEHYPSKNRYKNKIRKYALQRLKIPTLLPNYWKDKEKWWVETNQFKYNIFYLFHNKNLG